jgi:hypothetical protein
LGAYGDDVYVVADLEASNAGVTTVNIAIAAEVKVTVRDILAANNVDSTVLSR